jgi:GH18 family chitinase/predicted carbohydrate-binding protein with CBM5 and CBM33 domain
MNPIHTLLLFAASTFFLFGHGTVTSPISRVYTIYQEGPDSPETPSAMAAIALAGPNQYYTWNQVSKNIANYADPDLATTYSSVIPDGKLASGDSGSGLNFSGMDLVSNTWNWPATPVSVGVLPITWTATAPHDPSYFKAWITTADYDHKQPISWDKMEFLGQINSGIGGFTTSGNEYLFNVTLPERTGRHVLYIGWQRIDPVGECFFSTSDILFGDSIDPAAPPVVSITSGTVVEDAGSIDLTISLNRVANPDETASVNYATSNGSAGVFDFTSSSGTLIFAAGELSKTITLSIIDDAEEETDEIFMVTLSSPVKATLGAATANVTITDDDAPPPPADPGSVIFEKTADWGSGYQGWLRITNNGTKAWTNPTVTFDLNQPISFLGPGTEISDGAGGWTVTGINQTIAPSEILSLDFVIQPVSASDPRGPENVKINGAVLGDTPPSISINDASVPEGNSTDATAVINLTLSKAATEAIHLAYTTVDGSAVAGIDYRSTSGTVVFAIGETTKQISVSYDGDTIAEANKDFQILLSGVTGQDLPTFTNTSANVTFIDDDRPAVMTATSDIVMEGDNGTTDLTFNVNLSRAPLPDQVVSVSYRAHGHGATPGIDFKKTHGTLTFAPGESSKTITVPVIGDTVDEKLELLMLHFSLPIGLIMNTSEVVGQIIDNDIGTSGFGNQRVVAYVDATSGAPVFPPADRVTHIMYAFANLNANGTLTIAGPGLAGFTALKTQNPDLKIALSIGGWTWSDHFTTVAASPTLRQTFATACRNIIETTGIDGIDIDWEWPGVAGGPGTTPSARDGVNYTLLLQTLRNELDDLEADDGIEKHYEITAFTAASPTGIAQLELSALSGIFDFVNAQAYDLHGPWNPLTGHNAGLHHNSADPTDNRLNIEAILGQYLAGGFTKDQLLIGAPFYARTFNGTANTARGAFQTHNGSGATPLYRDLGPRLANQVRHWAPIAKVPFLYNQTTGEWTSYDDPQAMSEKASYSIEEGFGGVYYWESSGDTADRQLLTTISDTLAYPQTDTDEDGILDSWERTHFGDLTTANESTDWDLDGSADIAESHFLTDPKDHTIFPNIQSIPINSDGHLGTFQTVTGVTYLIERSLGLIDWDQHGSVFVGDGSIIIITYDPTQDHLYFRIQAIGR